ncbi:hypothetical protein [Streptomyces sp. NPDC001815]|uniref:hypothetical protein n=1 Tax=Streptomyces sp. NPDC001815 TaxID=3154526 RepID=UPI00331F3554
MSVRPGPQVTGRTARFGRGMLPEMGDTRAGRFADRCRSGSGSGRSPRDRYGGGRSAARRTDRPRTDGVAVGRQTYGAAAMADAEAPVADTEAAPVVQRLAEVADIVAAPVADAVAAPVVLRLGGRRVRSRRGSRR